MVLLSGFSGGAHQHGPVLVGPDASGAKTLAVSGTITGTFKGTSPLAPITATGHGTLTNVGAVTSKGTLKVGVTGSVESGSATFTASKGTLTITYKAGKSGVTITVTGGTKQYKGVSGHGTGSLSYKVQPGTALAGTFTLKCNVTLKLA
jgi:hypothetical protein